MPGWRAWLAVAAGGLPGPNSATAWGSPFRTPPGAVPWTTLGINVAGSFVLAALTTLWIARPHTAFWLRAGLGPGLLGSFTTFSARGVFRSTSWPGPASIRRVACLPGAVAAAGPGRRGRRLADGPALADRVAPDGGRIGDWRCPGGGSSVWRAPCCAFAVDSWFAPAQRPPRRHWPWATLLVNVTGCLIIGLSIGMTGRLGWHRVADRRRHGPCRRADHVQFLDDRHGAAAERGAVRRRRPQRRRQPAALRLRLRHCSPAWPWPPVPSVSARRHLRPLPSCRGVSASGPVWSPSRIVDSDD